MISRVAPPAVAGADAVAALVVAGFNNDHAARPGVLQRGLQEAHRVIDVLDHVPQCDDVIEVASWQVGQHAAAQVSNAIRSAGVDSAGVPSVSIGVRHKGPVACADIKQAPPSGAERGDKLQPQLGDLPAHIRIVIGMVLGLDIPTCRMIDALRHGTD